MIEFNGELYYDDRMYILYLCEATIERERDLDRYFNDKPESYEYGPKEIVTIRIYHQNKPKEHVWCLVTYRNCARYPMARINVFSHKEEAVTYLEDVEPSVPLISLGGNSPIYPLPYKEFVRWKQGNNFKDYDINKVYGAEPAGASESFFMAKDKFLRENPHFAYLWEERAR